MDGIKGDVKMMFQEERECPYCNKVFVVNGFKYCYAKTLSCYYCGKRFKVEQRQKEMLK
jgi:uncharacterized Zn-finger protein